MSHLMNDASVVLMHATDENFRTFRVIMLEQVPDDESFEAVKEVLASSVLYTFGMSIVDYIRRRTSLYRHQWARLIGKPEYLINGRGGHLTNEFFLSMHRVGERIDMSELQNNISSEFYPSANVIGFEVTQMHAITYITL